MIRPLTIAHTSDVHLHDDDGGELVQAAFAAAVDAVIESGAELFLIAGDLFDHNRVTGPCIDFVHAQLGRLACDTVIIAGNHDCFDTNSVLRNMDFAGTGAHLHLLAEPEGKVLEFPHLHATVWGRGMIEHAPENKPLAGSSARRGDFWHIGMAHGLYSDDTESWRSSLITPEEIAATGFDYLALGHVHAHNQMRHGSTLACYPGTPLPMGMYEKFGSLVLVDLVPGAGATVRQHKVPRPQLQVAV